MKWNYQVIVSGSVLYVTSNELIAGAVKSKYLAIGWKDVKIKKVKGNYGD